VLAHFVHPAAVVRRDGGLVEVVEAADAGLVRVDVPVRRRALVPNGPHPGQISLAAARAGDGRQRREALDPLPRRVEAASTIAAATTVGAAGSGATGVASIGCDRTGRVTTVAATLRTRRAPVAPACVVGFDALQKGLVHLILRSRNAPHLGRLSRFDGYSRFPAVPPVRLVARMPRFTSTARPTTHAATATTVTDAHRSTRAPPPLPACGPRHEHREENDKQRSRF
jgi:hypothetical protein